MHHCESSPRLEAFSPRCITVNRHQDWRPSRLDASLWIVTKIGEDAKINEEAEENETDEEVLCGCRHFRPVHRGIQGRRKDKLSEYIGFYDSLL
ncbi:hypothetical protein TNCV_528551 [Trichonephila clavipes]|nr:hypothetical protein TNCV_528551 [Trichonephila clavipes]